jgi:type I restriction enzyme M protein
VKLDADTGLSPLKRSLDKLHDTSNEFHKALKPFYDQFDKSATAVKKAVEQTFAIKSDDAPVALDAKKHPVPDPDLRDSENVPLSPDSVTWEPDVSGRLDKVEYRSAIDDYIDSEVRPYVLDAWVDYDKTKIGYEIPLTRHFYKYVAPRPLADIDAEIKQLEAEIQALLRGMAE